MSAIQKRLTEAALQALEVIGALAANYGGDKGKDAAKVLDTVGKIVKSVSDGFERQHNPEQVIAEIEQSVAHLEADIAQNDKAAEAELDAKWPAERPNGIEGITPDPDPTGPQAHE